MRSKSRPSILVVDDEPMILEALETVLTEPGRDLLMAGSLAEAIACPVPDLLIADVRLGDGSGLDLAWLFRSISPDLRVVLTTGDPTDLGGTPPPEALILPKPFDLEQIEELVETLMCVPVTVATARAAA
jgi:DNA-binding NtrC family response regulator